MTRTHKQQAAKKYKPSGCSTLVFKPYVFISKEDEIDIDAIRRESSEAVEKTIIEIGANKTTDLKISNACKRNKVDESRVRIIAGLDKGGMNEYQIVRL